MSVRCDNTSSAEGLYRDSTLSDVIPAFDAFTICGWSYIVSDTGSGVYQPLFEISDITTNYCGLYWEASTNGTMTLEGGGTGSPTPGANNFGSRPATGGWFFWAMTFGTSNVKGYWEPIGSSTISNSVSASQFGSSKTYTYMHLADQGGSPALDGRFYHVRAWSAELSQAELEAEMNSPSAIVRTSNVYMDTPLEAHTDITDNSANSYDWRALGTLSTEADPSFGGAVKRLSLLGVG